MSRAKPRVDPRARATGRLGTTRGERYALISEEVLTSAAYVAQPDWAKVVLFALAARFNGQNNGDLSLPFSEAKALGVGAQWKLYAGLRLLEHADLILCTRRGRVERGTKLASLYAVTWRPVEPSDKHDSPCDLPLSSNAWAKWQKPDDWREIVSRVQRANRGESRATKSAHTRQSGNGRSQLSGATSTRVAPDSRVKETTSIAPDSQETSKTSPVTGPDSGSESLSSELPSPSGPRTRRSRDATAFDVETVRGKVQRTLAADPDVPMATLVRMYAIPPDQVDAVFGARA